MSRPDPQEPHLLLARALTNLDAARGAVGTALYLEGEDAAARVAALTTQALQSTEAAAEALISASLAGTDGKRIAR